MTALLAPPSRAFLAEIATVPEDTRARMSGVSWHGTDPRCPSWDELAYLRFAHVTFDGGIGEGELVVAAAIASRTAELLRRLYQLGFPIRQAKLVDDYGASDDKSMADDNSSAFNFRTIAGTDILSQHAFGRAIDINPVENPWRKPDRLARTEADERAESLVPEQGREYADRTNIRPGMIVRPGPVVAVFDELGWEWGGDWLHASDDHHVVIRG